MKFSYQNLKYAAKNGEQIGKWKGSSVFSCGSKDLKYQGSGAYLVVYDDDNTIVSKSGNTWYSYGKVSENGQVMEWDKKKYGSYHYDTQTYEPPAAVVSAAVSTTKNVCGKQEECEAAHEVVVGDVKLGLDVDAVLKAAREMTVDSLLEGFNYGLDAKR